jgi:hypothetical protein
VTLDEAALDHMVFLWGCLDDDGLGPLTAAALGVLATITEELLLYSRDRGAASRPVRRSPELSRQFVDWYLILSGLRDWLGKHGGPRAAAVVVETGREDTEDRPLPWELTLIEEWVPILADAPGLIARACAEGLETWNDLGSRSSLDAGSARRAIETGMSILEVRRGAGDLLLGPFGSPPGEDDPFVVAFAAARVVAYHLLVLGHAAAGTRVPGGFEFMDAPITFSEAGYGDVFETWVASHRRPTARSVDSPAGHAAAPWAVDASARVADLVVTALPSYWALRTRPLDGNSWAPMQLVDDAIALFGRVDELRGAGPDASGGPEEAALDAVELVAEDTFMLPFVDPDDELSVRAAPLLERVALEQALCARGVADWLARLVGGTAAERAVRASSAAESVMPLRRAALRLIAAELHDARRQLAIQLRDVFDLWTDFRRRPALDQRARDQAGNGAIEALMLARGFGDLVYGPLGARDRASHDPLAGAAVATRRLARNLVLLAYAGEDAPQPPLTAPPGMRIADVNPPAEYDLDEWVDVHARS